MSRRHSAEKREIIPDAKYGDVVAVVDEIRSAGVDSLGLLTEKVKSTSPPKPAPNAGD